MRLRRVLAVSLVVVLLAALASGCGGQGASDETPATQEPTSGGIPTVAEDAQNPIDFSMFISTDDPLDGNTPIMQEIAKRTGVSLDIQTAAGMSSEKLSVMLASKDYTDVILMPRDTLFYQYLDSGGLVDLKPLLQTYASNVYDILNLPQNGSLIDRFSNQDGQLLYLTQDLEVIREGEQPTENLEDSNYVEEVLPWHRVLYTLYPAIQEVYGSKIGNMDELYAALKAYKQAYPDKNHYPITMSSTSGGSMIWAALSMNGYKVLSFGVYDGVYATKDGQTYEYVFKAPELLDFFKYMNKFYKEGLMDPEGPIQTDDQMQEKMNSGNVFAMMGSFIPIYDANANLIAADETKDDIYIPQKLLASGVENQWQYNYAYTGNNALVVTNKCEDPARFARFLSWLYTDEGIVLSTWGEEGVEYIVEDGIRDVTPEINETIQSDPDYYLKRGLGIPYYIIDWPAYTSDGQRATLEYAPFYLSGEGKDPRDVSVTDSPFNWHEDWGGTFWKDYDEVDIYADAQSSESQALAKAQALVDDAVSRMILADSTEELEQIYYDTLNQMEANGISQWEEMINEVITSRRNQ